MVADRVAQNYGGWQFGVWASQLGDGRAFSLFEATNPHTKKRYELQLKGGGKTPYSRFAYNRPNPPLAIGVDVGIEMAMRFCALRSVNSSSQNISTPSASQQPAPYPSPSSPTASPSANASSPAPSSVAWPKPGSASALSTCFVTVGTARRRASWRSTRLSMSLVGRTSCRCHGRGRRM